MDVSSKMVVFARHPSFLHHSQQVRHDFATILLQQNIPATKHFPPIEWENMASLAGMDVSSYSSEEVEQEASLLLMMAMKTKKKLQFRWLVHETLSKRKELGQFHT